MKFKVHLLALLLLLSVAVGLESLYVQTSYNYTGCKTYTAQSYSVVYCDTKYYAAMRSDISSTFEWKDTKKINYITPNSDPDQAQIVYDSFYGGYLEYDSFVNQINLQAQFYGFLLLQTTVSIEDYLFVDSDYGVVKFVNNTFALFTYIDSTIKYSQKKDFAGFKTYQMDHTYKTVYVGNGTDIRNMSVLADRSPSTGLIVSLYWNETVVFKKLNHTSFIISEPYLVLSCTTCNNSAGSIQLYNYLQPIIPVFNTTNTSSTNTTSNSSTSSNSTNTTSNTTTNTTKTNTTTNTTKTNTTTTNTTVKTNTTNTTTTTILNNITMVYQYVGNYTASQVSIGEKVYLDQLSLNRIRLMFTSKQNTSTVYRDVNQIDIYNFSGTMLYRNQLVQSQLSNFSYTSLSYSSNLLAWADSQITEENSTIRYLTFDYNQQCNVSEYYTNGKCASCKQYYGIVDPQQTSCEPCTTMVQNTDSYSSALSYEICGDPYTQEIPTDDNSGGDNSGGGGTKPPPITPGSISPQGGSNLIGPIVGGVVGGLGLIAIIVITVILVRRCKAKGKGQDKSQAKRQDAYKVNEKQQPRTEVTKQNEQLKQNEIQDTDQVKINNSFPDNKFWKGPPDQQHNQHEELPISSIISLINHQDNLKTDSELKPTKLISHAQMQSVSKATHAIMNLKDSPAQVRGDTNCDIIPDEESFSSNSMRESEREPDSNRNPNINPFQGSQNDQPARQYQSNSQYSQQFSMPVLGSQYLSNVSQKNRNSGAVEKKHAREDTIMQDEEDNTAVKQSARNLLNLINPSSSIIKSPSTKTPNNPQAQQEKIKDDNKDQSFSVRSSEMSSDND